MGRQSQVRSFFLDRYAYLKQLENPLRLKKTVEQIFWQYIQNNFIQFRFYKLQWFSPFNFFCKMTYPTDRPPKKWPEVFLSKNFFQLVIKIY